MRKITINQTLLFADRPQGNELLGLPHYLAPLLGNSDPEGNPLLTWLESVSPHAHPNIEVEITLRAYDRAITQLRAITVTVHFIAGRVSKQHVPCWPISAMS